MNSKEIEDLKKQLPHADLTLFSLLQGDVDGVERDAIDLFRTAVPKLIAELERYQENTERIKWFACNVCAITTRDGEGEEFTYEADGGTNIVEIIDELRAPDVVHEVGCLADDPDGCRCINPPRRDSTHDR